MEITKGVIESAQKVIIYGPEGIGKSTFASNFPNPYFIDTEGSTKKLNVQRLPKPSSWEMIMQEARYIKNNPSVCNTLVIDTADWAERFCIEHVCAKAGVKGLADFGYGNGYVYLGEEFGRLLNLLNEVVDEGVNVCFVAHSIIKKFERPDEVGAYDRYELKLEKKTNPLLKEWADMILFANYKTIVVNVDNQGAQKGKNKAQGGQRVMYTSHHPCWDAKNRHGLEEELPFEYEQIAAHIPVLDSKPLSEAIKETFDAKEIVEEEVIQTVMTDTKTETETENSELANAISKLEDLMKANDVTIEEIKKAVSSKGYYPEDTPISNYDPNFITGVLIGAWDQVYKQVENDRVPFK